jgi:hypothetical protein
VAGIAVLVFRLSRVVSIMNSLVDRTRKQTSAWANLWGHFKLLRVLLESRLQIDNSSSPESRFLKINIVHSSSSNAFKEVEEGKVLIFSTRSANVWARDVAVFECDLDNIRALNEEWEEI